MTRDICGSRPGQPKPPPDPDRLEHALTFFVTSAQRRAVLAVLRAHSTDRAAALLTALGIADQAADSAQTGGGRA